MKKKKNNDKIDLNQVLIASAAEISMRVIELSNQGLIRRIKYYLMIILIFVS